MLLKDRIKLNQKNTLEEIMDEFYKHFSRDELINIKLTYRSFRITYSFLPEIWSRIQSDVKLYKENSDIEATYFSPWAKEGDKPTEKEEKLMKEYKKHRNRIFLDIEDWFIHSHILMDKFAKLTRMCHQKLAKTPEEEDFAKDIPYRNFDRYRKYFLNPDKEKKITDKGYAKLIQKSTDWYIPKIMNIRDDLIQHELVPKLWGSSLSSTKNGVYFSFSKFRNREKTFNMIYGIKNKYLSTFSEIKDNNNFFDLLNFFEKHIKELNEKDVNDIKTVRKNYGGKLPDIIKLYNNMSNFFIRVNNHFITKMEKIKS